MSVQNINIQVALAAKSNRQQAQPLAFEAAYGATWSVIEESNNIIGRLNKPVFDLKKEEAEVVFLMFFNGLSDIISAVYTLSSGWIRPSVTALRGALETIAAATAIHHDPKRMERFVKGKLNIPDQVNGPVKEIFPSIGSLYGMLTNQFTHEKIDSTGRSIDQSARTLMMVPSIRTDNISIYLNVFIKAATLAQMIGIGLETCFPRLSGEEVHFATNVDGGRSRSHASSTKAIQVAVQAWKYSLATAIMN